MSSPIFCAFHLQGKCIYGDTCRFPHTSPHLKDGAGTPSGLPKASNDQSCKFYSKGYCIKGRNCVFSHVASSAQASQPIGITSSPPIHSPTTCLFFKQQKCKNGTACRFSHNLSDPVKPAPSEGKSLDGETGHANHQGGTLNENALVKLGSLESSSPTGSRLSQSQKETLIELEFDRCRVLFAPGPTVYSIETAFESRCIVLTNIPDVCSREDVLHILTPAYECKVLVIDRRAKPPTARLELSSAKQAAEALGHLHGIALLGAKISTRIDSARTTTDSASLRSTKVKVSWFKPSRIAWAHYNKFTRAQEDAKRLQGKTFNGHKLSVVLQQKTPNQRESFSVEIKGLPLKFDDNDLKRFCHASKVTVGGCSFDGPRSYKEVEQLLGRHGILESIEPAPENSKSGKLVVFAHYREWKDAEKACKELHMQTQSFLRYSPLMLENVHAIRYNVSQPRYMVVKWELLRLQRRQPSGCKLRIYDEMDASTVCVRGYSSSAKSLASLKISLEVLIRGETVTHADNSIVWEDRFAGKEAQEPILTLARKHECWIEFDLIHRKIRLFGSPEHCKFVRTNILKTVDALKQQRHVINIDLSALRGLLTGGLHHIEQLLGEGKCSLDIRRRQLTVEGSDTTLIQIREKVRSMDQSYTLWSGPACPVCLGEPVNPTVLACGHAYCTSCITQYLKVQSASRSPDCSCLFVQDKTACETPIHTDILRRLLTPEEETRIFRAVYRDYIHSRPKEFLYCPAVDCPTIYRRAPGVIRCPECLTKICTSCEVEYHNGITCVEYQAELRKELAIIERWKQELGIRSCPNCKTDMAKEDGCNHLICIQCKRHICWVCMETFEDSKGSYIHIGDKHRGIGVNGLTLRGESSANAPRMVL